MVDTEVTSDLLWNKGRHNEYRQFLVGRSVIAVSFVTVAELRGGAKSLGERRREELETSLRRYVVVPYDSAVVDVYATLHAARCRRQSTARTRTTCGMQHAQSQRHLDSR